MDRVAWTIEPGCMELTQARPIYCCMVASGMQCSKIYYVLFHLTQIYNFFNRVVFAGFGWSISFEK